MPKFLIQREIPGAHNLTAAELQGISAKSVGVIHGLNLEGHDIQWVHSFISDDKITCVYIAPDEKTLREHAVRGSFPANAITEVKGMIDPMTAETKA